MPAAENDSIKSVASAWSSLLHPSLLLTVTKPNLTCFRLRTDTYTCDFLFQVPIPIRIPKVHCLTYKTPIEATSYLLLFWLFWHVQDSKDPTPYFPRLVQLETLELLCTVSPKRCVHVRAERNGWQAANVPTSGHLQYKPIFKALFSIHQVLTSLRVKQTPPPFIHLCCLKLLES